MAGTGPNFDAQTLRDPKVEGAFVENLRKQVQAAIRVKELQIEALQAEITGMHIAVDIAERVARQK